MKDQRFERGTSLSIFVSDRREDVSALILAFAIAIGVLIFVGK